MQLRMVDFKSFAETGINLIVGAVGHARRYVLNNRFFSVLFLKLFENLKPRPYKTAGML